MPKAKRRHMPDDFLTPMETIEEVLVWGEAEFGRPCRWDGTPDINPRSNPDVLPRKPEQEEEDQDEDQSPVCSRGLHNPAVEGTEADGECRPCRRLRHRLRAAERRGDPLCWTGTHPEPEEGLICGCGEAPPPDTWIDWVIVEDALQNREPFRPLTNAEKCSLIRTAVARDRQVDNGVPSPMWSELRARTWVNANTSVYLTKNQYRYLIHEWLPKNGGKVPNAYEAFLEEVSEQSEAVSLEQAVGEGLRMAG
jgi:hypothetical protein